MVGGLDELRAVVQDALDDVSVDVDFVCKIRLVTDNLFFSLSDLLAKDVSGSENGRLRTPGRAVG
jgi:hypothetical protein